MVGGMAKLVEKYGEDLKKDIDRKGSESPEEKAVEFVVEHDIDIWNVHYGRCFLKLMPQHSACHELKGTPTLLRQKPAIQFRSLETCAGCKCLGVYQEHAPFWRARVAEKTAILEAARKMGEEKVRELRVEQIRLRIAKSFVSGLERRSSSQDIKGPQTDAQV